MADELFNQADLDKDQRLNLEEFRNLIAQNLGANATASIYTGNNIDGGQYGLDGYGSSASGAYTDFNNGAGYGGISDFGTNFGSNSPGQLSGNGNYASFEQASYSSPSPGSARGEYNVNAMSPNGKMTATSGASASSSSFETAGAQQQVQQYPNTVQGLYQDPNPQIIRRPAQGGHVTYTQNIKIRFLQPPAIPPPGPLIIKEVRPPQPPPPPPLVVRQRAPPIPQQPPLILREKPPPIPAAVGAETVIRKLPPVPIPPRSVIIERLPPLPPKPRDIIIERWIPYGAMTKRKTIVQRAEEAKPYPKPRNIIIQYEAPQVRVVRQFQRLGITPENPQAYTDRYGASLMDAQTLVQQARAAGVIEDISPPSTMATTVTSSSSYNGDFTNVSSGVDATGHTSASSYESSNYIAQQGISGYPSFETTQGDHGFASTYESNSFALPNTSNASAFQGYNFSTGGHFGFANSAFNAADANRDGSIDPNEFRQYISS